MAGERGQGEVPRAAQVDGLTCGGGGGWWLAAGLHQHSARAAQLQRVARLCRGSAAALPEAYSGASGGRRRVAQCGSGNQRVPEATSLGRYLGKARQAAAPERLGVPGRSGASVIGPASRTRAPCLALPQNARHTRHPPLSDISIKRARLKRTKEETPSKRPPRGCLRHRSAFGVCPRRPPPAAVRPHRASLQHHHHTTRAPIASSLRLPLVVAAYLVYPAPTRTRHVTQRPTVALPSTPGLSPPASHHSRPVRVRARSACAVRSGTPAPWSLGLCPCLDLVGEPSHRHPAANVRLATPCMMPAALQRNSSCTDIGFTLRVQFQKDDFR